MIRTARIDLPDGRQLDYEIRPSAKARSLRLKMTVRDGLTVIAPKGLNERKVVELVAGKRDWIAARLKQFDEVRHLLGETSTACPQAFDLPALAESWRLNIGRLKPGSLAQKLTDRGVYWSMVQWVTANGAKPLCAAGWRATPRKPWATGWSPSRSKPV